MSGDFHTYVIKTVAVSGLEIFKTGSSSLVSQVRICVTSNVLCGATWQRPSESTSRLNVRICARNGFKPSRKQAGAAHDSRNCPWC